MLKSVEGLGQTAALSHEQDVIAPDGTEVTTCFGVSD